MTDQSHRIVRMTGRDVAQVHRAATPLELLFDLAFVIAFGTAANELAHALVEDHVRVGVVGFCFATFAVSWAWINFAWFASAFDTDDWIYRLTTMVQMVGVLILALGLPDMFASLEEGEVLDNRVMVLGYVVMRAPDGLPVDAGGPPGPRPSPGRAGLHHHHHGRAGRVGRAAGARPEHPRDLRPRRPCWSSSSSPGRCTPRPGPSARPGTPTTSPSGTA